MITRIVRLDFGLENSPVFLDHFARVSDDIRNFPGCMELEMLADLNQTGVYFTISRWRDLESFESYKQSILFKSTWATVKPLFVAKAQAWSLGDFKDIYSKPINPLVVS
ncbi:MAG: putative quinol monooxygenase [Bacteroidota bacterium]|jgi:quinol monooxygenase YgiN